MIKSYRGLIVDGGEDRIPLHTNDGKTGYRVVKLQLFPNKPGTENTEATVSVFKTSGKGSGTSTAVVNFSDNQLLAAAYYQEDHQQAYVASETVIFDNEVFNQDIFVTMTDTAGAQPVNYYMELEQIKLSEQEALIAIVKDLKEEQS